MFANDKAFMTHMEQFLQEEFIPKILTMMELTSLKMLGPVTEEIDDFFTFRFWVQNLLFSRTTDTVRLMNRIDIKPV